MTTKHHLWIVFFIITRIHISFSQPLPINQHNEKGERNGHWKVFIDSNYAIINDTSSCYLKTYYLNGQIEGLSKSYYPHHQLKWQGKLIDLSTFTIEGNTTSFYPLGELFKKNVYHNNLLQGVQSTFYRSGQLKELKTYQKNKLEGPYSSYFFNGRLKSQGQYQHDLKEGKWRFFSLNGRLLYEVQYRNDQPDSPSSTIPIAPNQYDSLHQKKGLWLYWLDKNEAITTPTHASYYLLCRYTEGVLSGQAHEYYLNGQLYAKATYSKGDITGVKSYYTKSKTLLKTCNYKKGLLHGKSITYYPSGKIKAIEKYKKGKQHSKSTTYSPAHQLITLKTYKSGYLHGKHLLYYTNHQLKLAGQYKNGIKEGKWKWYQEDGSLKRSKEYIFNGEEKIKQEVFNIKKSVIECLLHNPTAFQATYHKYAHQLSHAYDITDGQFARDIIGVFDEAYQYDHLALLDSMFWITQKIYEDKHEKSCISNATIILHYTKLRLSPTNIMKLYPKITFVESILRPHQATHLEEYMTCNHYLSKIHLSLNHFDKASALLHQTRTLLDEHASIEHLFSNENYFLLGQLYAKRSNSLKAQMYLYEALKHIEKDNKEHTPLYFNCLKELAGIKRSSQHYQQAISYYQKALDLYVALYELPDNDYLHCTQQLAFLFFKLKKYNQAQLVIQNLKLFSTQHQVISLYTQGIHDVLKGELYLYQDQQKKTDLLFLTTLNKLSQLQNQKVYAKIGYQIFDVYHRHKKIKPAYQILKMLKKDLQPSSTTQGIFTQVQKQLIEYEAKYKIILQN